MMLTNQAQTPEENSPTPQAVELASTPTPTAENTTTPDDVEVQRRDRGIYGVESAVSEETSLNDCDQVRTAFDYYMFVCG